MTGTIDIPIREMTMTDYDQVYGLWTEIKGLGIRSIDDSWDGVKRFLRGNPITNAMAVQNGHIIGNILYGHDGRTGCLCHVCAVPGYRKHGVGYRTMRFAMEALQKEGINEIGLIALKGNEVGSAFWRGIGWREREDMNTYEFIPDEENITRFVR